MRVHTAATAALVLAVTLTGCGGGDSSDDAKPPAAAKSSEPAEKVDCTNSELTQAEWAVQCDGTGTGGDGTDETVVDSDPKPLGTPIETIGDGGAGVLEMTPTTVVYAKQDGGDKPAKDVFAVIAIKQRPTTAAAATEVPPISGGGWQWIAPDGQAIDAGNGESYNVVLADFNAAGPIQPGSFVWDATAFDLTDAQAKGGTLVYLDGEGDAHRWTIPGGDRGPQVAEVRGDLG
ncbi:hypothetical protein [Streptomyces sp. NPDC091212]|uniref:hypothetical protein n=1 Tax=Streptomyces sp. NPDC091212 TaxID=3155191 RepID=UPI0034304E14